MLLVMYLNTLITYDRFDNKYKTKQPTIKQTMIKHTILSLGIAAIALGSSSQAATILATNFDSPTLSGNTISGLVWTTDDPNGAQVVGATSATTNASSFATDGGNPDQFAPDENIATGNLGFWTGTFTFDVLAGFTADLTDITFDYDSRAASGLLQNASNMRDILFVVTVDGVAYGSLFGGVVAGAADFEATITDSLSLAEGTHTVVITAASAGSQGVFTSIDDLSINGAVNPVVVPEPSSTALLGLSALALILRRRK